MYVTILFVRVLYWDLVAIPGTNKSVRSISLFPDGIRKKNLHCLLIWEVFYYSVWNVGVVHLPVLFMDLNDIRVH